MHKECVFSQPQIRKKNVHLIDNSENFDKIVMQVARNRLHLPYNSLSTMLWECGSRCLISSLLTLFMKQH